MGVRVVIMLNDKLQEILEYVFDVAERNNMLINYGAPKCDTSDNSIVITNNVGITGLLCYIPEDTLTPVRFYILDVAQYQWGILEGFDEEDILESDDFNVLQEVDIIEFCNVICKQNKSLKKQFSII